VRNYLEGFAFRLRSTQASKLSMEASRSTLTAFPPRGSCRIEEKDLPVRRGSTHQSEGPDSGRRLGPSPFGSFSLGTRESATSVT
jgi:hypothetical protein